jgi:hypothetical protein
MSFAGRYIHHKTYCNKQQQQHNTKISTKEATLTARVPASITNTLGRATDGVAMEVLSDDTPFTNSFFGPRPLFADRIDEA